MQCQQRKAKRCPRSSRQVPEADRAPPADAFELLPDILRGVIRVSLMRMIEACLSPVYLPSDCGRHPLGSRLQADAHHARF